MTKGIRYGEALEHKQWLQGTIVTAENAKAIVENASNLIEIDPQQLLSGDFILLTASQSCYIANDDLSSSPSVEFSVGRPIGELSGNYTFNKNPRKLHTHYQEATESGVEAKNIEIVSKESVYIQKIDLVNLGIDFHHEAQLGYLDLESYVAWLTANYNKPALPTEFNNRLIEADRKDKRKKKAKSLSPILSGIYIEISPFKELPAEEHYNVNLLGLLPAGKDADIDQATKTMKEFADLMQSATMNVKLIVTTEDKISVARLRSFKRFYYDDLSYRDSTHPLPLEVEQ